MTEAQNKANAYLSEIRNADKEINEMILKIDYLRYKASGAGAIRYDKDRIMNPALLCMRLILFSRGSFLFIRQSNL